MISKLLNIALIILIAGLVGNYIYKLPKFSKGNEVPAPKIVLKDGTKFNLYSLENRYVLINFCGFFLAEVACSLRPTPTPLRITHPITKIWMNFRLSMILFEIKPMSILASFA